MNEKFEYNPNKDYKTEYYESLTIVMTPYGKVSVRIRSDNPNAFTYAKKQIFPELKERDENE